MDYEKAYLDMRAMYEKTIRFYGKMADKGTPEEKRVLLHIKRLAQRDLDRHDSEFGGENGDKQSESGRASG